MSWTQEVVLDVLKLAVTLHVQMNCPTILQPCPPMNLNYRTHAHPKPMGMGMDVGTQCRALIPNLVWPPLQK